MTFHANTLPKRHRFKSAIDFGRTDSMHTAAISRRRHDSSIFRRRARLSAAVLFRRLTLVDSPYWRFGHTSHELYAGLLIE